MSTIANPTIALSLTTIRRAIESTLLREMSHRQPVTTLHLDWAEGRETVDAEAVLASLEASQKRHKAARRAAATTGERVQALMNEAENAEQAATIVLYNSLVRARARFDAEINEDADGDSVQNPVQEYSECLAALHESWMCRHALVLRVDAMETALEGAGL